MVSRIDTFVFLLVQSGCASESAESALTAFMDAQVDGDVAAAYALLSDADRAAMT